MKQIPTSRQTDESIMPMLENLKYTDIFVLR